MSRKPHFYDNVNLIIGVLGLVLGIASTAIAVQQGWVPVLVGQNDRFSCELQPDTEKGGQVWTVMYRNDKTTNPWLKMVSTLGRDWTPATRCEEIAERLENYRQDGLTKLDYREDPATPGQYVICAHTKLSGDQNCPLLMTLNPGTDPYKILREMTEALRNGNGVYQNKEGRRTDTLSPDKPEVNLESLLAEEDQKE